MKLSIVCSTLLLGLAMTAQAQSPDDGEATSDCEARGNAETPPSPQVDADAAGLRGEVMLLIRIDRCGLPLRVEVEKSSGHRQLDDVAVAAAKSWRLPPQGENGIAEESWIRVPIRFDPDTGGPDPRPTSRSRPRDEFFVARRAMLAKAPVLDGSGKVPGFVADEYPIGVTDIQQAVAMLDRYGQRHPDSEPLFRQYEVIDEEGISFWYLIGDPELPAKALYRQRAVSDGTRGFWVTSSLCEPSDALICGKRFNELFAAFPPQPDLPPPPPAPPPKPDDQ